MYYDDEFYNEPSEFDEMVEEFKQSLAESIKEEHTKEVERLRKENQALREVKRDFNKIKEEYLTKERALITKEAELKKDIKNMTTKELIKRIEETIYYAFERSVADPKCDKCDNSRRIKFQSPSGKDLYEKCNCDTYSGFHEVRSMCICKIEFKWSDVTFRYEDGRLNFTEIAKNHKFKESEKDFVDKSKIYFRCKDLCQKYCDWLNEGRGKEND